MKKTPAIVLWSNAHLENGFEEMTIEVAPMGEKGELCENWTTFRYFGIDGRDFDSYNRSVEVEVHFSTISQVVDKMKNDEDFELLVLNAMNLSIKKGSIHPEDVDWENIDSNTPDNKPRPNYRKRAVKKVL